MYNCQFPLPLPSSKNVLYLVFMYLFACIVDMLWWCRVRPTTTSMMTTRRSTTAKSSSASRDCATGGLCDSRRTTPSKRTDSLSARPSNSRCLARSHMHILVQNFLWCRQRATRIYCSSYVEIPYLDCDCLCLYRYLYLLSSDMHIFSPHYTLTTFCT